VSGSGFTVRTCTRADHAGVSDILYATGFLGEDLSGTGLFNDRKLFELVNTEGYLRYLPESCFVAVDDADGRVVGYILGAADTRQWGKIFTRRMYWRIALRGFLVSWWRHPESFRHVLAWSRDYTDVETPFVDEYPAHLHINVRPGCQRRGIGEALLRAFEDHLTARGVAGIHLVTSNRNLKALPFYVRHGYVVLGEKPGTHYRGVSGHRTVICGKKLEG
jgi:ribosomal protein S18 acetylase RimI-like enzyme